MNISANSCRNILFLLQSSCKVAKQFLLENTVFEGHVHESPESGHRSFPPRTHQPQHAPARWHQRPRGLWLDLPALPCPRWARTCRPPGTPCGSAARPPAPSPWCPRHRPGPAPPGTAWWGAPGQHLPHEGNQTASAGVPQAPPLAETRAQIRGQPGSRLLVSRLPAAPFPAPGHSFPGS